MEPDYLGALKARNIGKNKEEKNKASTLVLIAVEGIERSARAGRDKSRCDNRSISALPQLNLAFKPPSVVSTPDSYPPLKGFAAEGNIAAWNSRPDK